MPRLKTWLIKIVFAPYARVPKDSVIMWNLGIASATQDRIYRARCNTAIHN